jgi:hypothetical protein
MTTDTERRSATIYTFPPRGRFAAPYANAAQPNTPTARAAQAAIGSGWYHEDAIRETDTTRKN